MVRQVKNLKRRELLLEYFQISGFHVDEKCSTSKYLCIVSPTRPEKLFLGKSGALRKGPNVSNSISLTDRLTDEYLDRMRAKVQAFRDEQKAKK